MAISDTAEERLRTDYFLVLADAAAILHMDPRTVRRLILKGQIPAKRVGEKWLIPTEWLRSC